MILDTWKRAKRRSSEGVALMPPAGFQNYSSTASAATMFVFISPRRDPYIYFPTLHPIFLVLPVVSQWQIMINFSMINEIIDGTTIENVLIRDSRARISKVVIIFINGRIYNISYFNLLKETGVPRLVAAKRKRSEWFSKIRLLQPT